jgi:hypothetical protein
MDFSSSCQYVAESDLMPNNAQHRASSASSGNQSPCTITLQLRKAEDVGQNAIPAVVPQILQLRMTA